MANEEAKATLQAIYEMTDRQISSVQLKLELGKNINYLGKDEAVSDLALINILRNCAFFLTGQGINIGYIDNILLVRNVQLAKIAVSEDDLAAKAELLKASIALHNNIKSTFFKLFDVSMKNETSVPFVAELFITVFICLYQKYGEDLYSYILLKGK